MKNLRKILLTAGIVYGLCSCEVNDIQLSTEELFFTAAGGTKELTATGKWWGISSFDMWIGDTRIIEYDNILFEYNNSGYIKSAVGSWFMIEELSFQKMTVSLQKNETGLQRKIYIYLNAGDSGGCVSVFQSAN
ncbi:MAG: hypothetical protein LBS01_01790 [Prevotellaceae bacterium]|jgi:hypothetical protein|nr:hypothetical protein [Prevotellaceae bacterium]